MPFKLSAEPLEREERQKLLDETAKKGFVENFNAVRISKSGKRFLIKNVILFNLYDDEGNYKGQTATFDKWEYI